MPTLLSHILLLHACGWFKLFLALGFISSLRQRGTSQLSGGCICKIHYSYVRCFMFILRKSKLWDIDFSCFNVSWFSLKFRTGQLLVQCSLLQRFLLSGVCNFLSCCILCFLIPELLCCFCFSLDRTWARPYDSVALRSVKQFTVLQYRDSSSLRQLGSSFCHAESKKGVSSRGLCH